MLRMVPKKAYHSGMKKEKLEPYADI